MIRQLDEGESITNDAHQRFRHPADSEAVSAMTEQHGRTGQRQCKTYGNKTSNLPKRSKDQEEGSNSNDRQDLSMKLQRSTRTWRRAKDRVKRRLTAAITGATEATIPQQQTGGL